MGKEIRLFWWSETRLMKKSRENYGDLMSCYLIEKISGKKVKWVFPKKFSLAGLFLPNYLAIGSILTHANEKSIVWGSGIIAKKYPIKKATFLAVRGPQTRRHLMEQGYNVPEVYGDPALLLPKYYQPITEKKYKWGVVPHYNDYRLVVSLYGNIDNVLVIDLMTTNVEATTRQFLSCESIISSSLHGVIVSHAYEIPAVWVQFSDAVFGDGIKYQDYFESVGIESYIPEITSEKLEDSQIMALFTKYESLPQKENVEAIQKGLMAVCPFIYS